MKVLLIDVNCKKGSTGKIVYDLYTELNKDGHIASICYGRGEKIKESNILKISSDFEMYIHAFLTRITGLNGYYSPFATRKLISYIKKFNPDVIHIHDPKTYYMNIKLLVKYLNKNNIKVIWTFHSEFMYTGKCGYAYDCNKWKNECDKCPQLKQYPKSIFFDYTNKMFNDKKNMLMDFKNLTIITPSKWLANRVKQSFLKNKKTYVIHNGIDTQNVFHPREFNHIKEKHNIKDEKIVISVAPDIMCERKGGRYILELAKKMKNENVKFILIGVTDLSEKFDENVIAVGRTENQIELAEYYSMADIFVICSKRENFPTTCIEAICCGTPVLGFDEGGTKETAPDGYGKFVNFGDVDKLSNVLKLALENKLKLKTKQECAIYGKENYDKNVMYKKYLNLYEKDIINS